MMHFLLVSTFAIGLSVGLVMGFFMGHAYWRDRYLSEVTRFSE